jgi:hypothetical protein
MSRCILLSHSLLLVLIQHVCESARGGWCVLDGVTRYSDWIVTGVLPFHGYLTRDKKNAHVIIS